MTQAERCSRVLVIPTVVLGSLPDLVESVVVRHLLQTQLKRCCENMAVYFAVVVLDGEEFSYSMSVV